MEKIKKYASIVHAFLEECCETSPNSHIVVDTKSHHYQLLKTGYDSHGTYFFRVRMHFHIRKDGKVCILENTTDIEIADFLIEHGIPKIDILPAFIPEDARKLVGYAL